MANPDLPMGFLATPLLQSNIYTKDSSAAAVYPGDLCDVEADGNVDVVAATGPEIIGAATNWTVASVADSVTIADSPGQRYHAQDDGVGTTAAVTNVGNNADILATAGDATLKQSRQEIDASTMAEGTAQIRLLGQVEGPEQGDYGANTLWHCVINEHHIQKLAGI